MLTIPSAFPTAGVRVTKGQRAAKWGGPARREGEREGKHTTVPLELGERLEPLCLWALMTTLMHVLTLSQGIDSYFNACPQAGQLTR